MSHLHGVTLDLAYFFLSFHNQRPQACDTCNKPPICVAQEMNGTANEAEVRRAAQLFGDLVRVVSAKQLGPMLRTQVNTAAIAMSAVSDVALRSSGGRYRKAG